MNKEQIQLEITREESCDVLVVGGGVAGISAAVTAAEAGADVILAERDGCLGGTASVGLVGPFMSSFDPLGKEQVIRGFMDRFIKRMAEKGGAIHPSDCHGGDSYSAYRIRGHIGVTPFDPECLKETAEEFCEEAGVRLRYHLLLISCETENGVIKRAFFATKSGITAIRAKCFIDCTGDADLAVLSGAPTVYGDENGKTQVSSLFFIIDGVDRDRLRAFVSQYPEDTHKRQRYLEDVVEKCIAEGTFPSGRSRVSVFESLHGFWRVNMTQYDGDESLIDPEGVTQAEIICRKQIRPTIEFLKKHVPGFENCRLVYSANSLGIRESRRIVGEYVLTIDDLKCGKQFDDRICLTGNAVDFHGIAKRDGSYNGAYYVTGSLCASIPYRSLLPKDTVNLAVAGRCLSADQAAHSAVRVMPPCFAMGQAAGEAAAMAAKSGISLREIDIRKLQENLVQGGALLDLPKELS